MVPYTSICLCSQPQENKPKMQKPYLKPYQSIFLLSLYLATVHRKEVCLYCLDVVYLSATAFSGRPTCFVFWMNPIRLLSSPSLGDLGRTSSNFMVLWIVTHCCQGALYQIYQSSPLHCWTPFGLLNILIMPVFVNGQETKLDFCTCRKSIKSPLGSIKSHGFPFLFLFSCTQYYFAIKLRNNGCVRGYPMLANGFFLVNQLANLGLWAALKSNSLQIHLCPREKILVGPSALVIEWTAVLLLLNIIETFIHLPNISLNIMSK